VKALQIRDVAWDVKREDLPLPVLRHLIPASETFDDEAALRGPITFVNDNLVWTNDVDAKR
jgi:hypothetical protein